MTPHERSHNKHSSCVPTTGINPRPIPSPQPIATLASTVSSLLDVQPTSGHSPLHSVTLPGFTHVLVAQDISEIARHVRATASTSCSQGTPLVAVLLAPLDPSAEQDASAIESEVAAVIWVDAACAGSPGDVGDALIRALGGLPPAAGVTVLTATQAAGQGAAPVTGDHVIPQIAVPEPADGTDVVSEAVVTGTSDGDHVQVVAHRIAAVLSEIVGAPVGVEDALMDAGVDSALAVSVSETLSDTLGVPLPPTLVFDHPTAAAIARAVASSVVFARRSPPERLATAVATLDDLTPSTQNGASKGVSQCAARDRVMAALRDCLSSVCGVTEAVSDTDPFMDIGVDSATAKGASKHASHASSRQGPLSLSTPLHRPSRCLFIHSQCLLSPSACLDRCRRVCVHGLDHELSVRM